MISYILKDWFGKIALHCHKNWSKEKIHNFDAIKLTHIQEYYMLLKGLISLKSCMIISQRIIVDFQITIKFGQYRIF